MTSWSEHRTIVWELSLLVCRTPRIGTYHRTQSTCTHYMWIAGERSNQGIGGPGWRRAPIPESPLPDKQCEREGDPNKGLSTVLVAALGSWGNLVPRGHYLSERYCQNRLAKDIVMRSTGSTSTSRVRILYGSLSQKMQIVSFGPLDCQAAPISREISV